MSQEQRGFPAKRAGRCPVCGDEFAAGETIRMRYSQPFRSRGHNGFEKLGFGHAVCATTPAQRRKANQDAHHARIREELLANLPIYRAQIEWIESGRVSPEWALAIRDADQSIETAWGDYRARLHRSAHAVNPAPPISGECQQAILAIYRNVGRESGLGIDAPGDIRHTFGIGGPYVAERINRYLAWLRKVIAAIEEF